MKKKTTIDLMHKFLQLQGKQVDCIKIYKIYSIHPLPHSIRSLSDVFDELHIDNIVCQISLEQLSEAPIPSIIFLKDYPDLFYIFRGFDMKNNVILESGRAQIILKKEIFAKAWDGIILMTGPSDKQITRRYHIKQLMWYCFKKSILLSFILLMCFIIYLVFLSSDVERQLIDKYVVIVLCSLGLIMSLSTIVKSHYNTTMLRRICSVTKQDGCTSVLNSNGAYICEWVTLGELSLSYFCSMLMICIVLPYNIMNFIALMSFLTLFPVLYSVIWQIRNKELCSLCCIIDAVLIVLLIYTIPHIVKNEYNSTIFLLNLIGFSLCYAICLLVSKSLTVFFENIKKYNELESKNERVLAHPELLNNLLEKEPIRFDVKELDEFAISNDIHEFEHRITIIINPNCKHCSSVVKIIDYLVGQKIDIIFLTNGGDTRATIAVKRIINQSSFGRQCNFSLALSLVKEWYTTGNTSLENIPTTIENTILEEHKEFCKRHNISSTPSIYIDGKALPYIYDISDLQYIL